MPVYYVLAPAEASSNLSRFDGVRYGYRAPEYIDLNDMYRKSRAQGFGAEVKRRILIGTYVLSHGYYDAYYIQAQKLRRLIALDFAEAFKQCDVIMGPTSPTVAFDLGEKSSDPVQMYLSDAYTIAVNLAGLPGMSIPVGFGNKNRPVGLHIVGNYFTEAQMLNVAHQYQRVTEWHMQMPGNPKGELPPILTCIGQRFHLRDKYDDDEFNISGLRGIQFTTLYGVLSTFDGGVRQVRYCTNHGRINFFVATWISTNPKRYSRNAMGNRYRS